MRFHYAGIVTLSLVALLLVACGTSAPPASKNVGRIGIYNVETAKGDRVIGGPARATQYLAIVIKVEDEAGNIVFDERNRKMFSFYADLPPGNYRITHTCSSTLLKWEDYRDAQSRWPNPILVTKLDLKSGKLWELKVIAGMSLENENRRRDGMSRYVGYSCKGQYQTKR